VLAGAAAVVRGRVRGCRGPEGRGGGRPASAPSRRPCGTADAPPPLPPLLLLLPAPQVRDAVRVQTRRERGARPTHTRGALAWACCSPRRRSGLAASATSRGGGRLRQQGSVRGPRGGRGAGARLRLPRGVSGREDGGAALLLRLRRAGRPRRSHGRGGGSSVSASVSTSERVASCGTTAARAPPQQAQGEQGGRGRRGGRPGQQPRLQATGAWARGSRRPSLRAAPALGGRCVHVRDAHVAARGAPALAALRVLPPRDATGTRCARLPLAVAQADAAAAVRGLGPACSGGGGGKRGRVRGSHAQGAGARRAVAAERGGRGSRCAGAAASPRRRRRCQPLPSALAAAAAAARVPARGGPERPGGRSSPCGRGGRPSHTRRSRSRCGVVVGSVRRGGQSHTAGSRPPYPAGGPRGGGERRAERLRWRGPRVIRPQRKGGLATAHAAAAAAWRHLERRRLAARHCSGGVRGVGWGAREGAPVAEPRRGRSMERLASRPSSCCPGCSQAARGSSRQVGAPPPQGVLLQRRDAALQRGNGTPYSEGLHLPLEDALPNDGAVKQHRRRRIRAQARGSGGARAAGGPTPSASGQGGGRAACSRPSRCPRSGSGSLLQAALVARPAAAAREGQGGVERVDGACRRVAFGAAQAAVAVPEAPPRGGRGVAREGPCAQGRLRTDRPLRVL